MSKQERHKGCGGLVYAHHQGDKWYLFCCKCGKKTDIYNNYNKARQAWDRVTGKERMNDL